MIIIIIVTVRARAGAVAVVVVVEVVVAVTLVVVVCWLNVTSCEQVIIMAESPGPATTGRSLVQQSTEQNANSSYPSPSHLLPLKRKKKEPGAPTLKNVVVLRRGDVRKREGKLLMPYTTEMSAIKKSPKPRFKKLEISSSMTQCDIQAKLEEIFPYLQQQRYDE